MTGVAYLRLAQHLITATSSRSSSPLPAAHTGLTPRLREMGGASLRPSLRLLDSLQGHGYCNKLHVVGSSKLLYIDFDAVSNREMSPLDAAVSLPPPVAPVTVAVRACESWFAGLWSCGRIVSAHPQRRILRAPARLQRMRSYSAPPSLCCHSASYQTLPCIRRSAGVPCRRI
jgi:hypothetical protein